MFTTGFQLRCDQLKDNWMYLYRCSLASGRQFVINCCEFTFFLLHSFSFSLLCNVLLRLENIRGSSRRGRGYRPSMNRNDSDLSAAGDLCCKSCPVYFSLPPHFLTSLILKHPSPLKNTWNFNISLFKDCSPTASLKGVVSLLETFLMLHCAFYHSDWKCKVCLCGKYCNWTEILRHEIVEKVLRNLIHHAVLVKGRWSCAVKEKELPVP